MLKSKSSQWSAMTALLCVVLLVATWFFLISPRRDGSARVREEAASVLQQNELLKAKVDQLKAQSVELPERRAELAKIYAQMPATAAMPELLTKISTMADDAGVVMETLTPGDAELMVASTQTGATSSAATGSTAASSGGTTAPSDGLTDLAAAPIAPAATGARVVQQPLSITVTGQYFENVLFVKKLQNELNRIFLIEGLNMQAADKNKVTIVITGKVFNLPDAAADATVAKDNSGDGSDGASATPSAQPSTEPKLANALPPNGSRAGVSTQGSAEDS